MNCQLFLGVIVKSMGRSILEVPRSAELFEDLEHTQFVEDLSESQTGDIIFLTDDSIESDPMWYHVGVVLVASDGRRWIIHNASHNGFAVIEKLEEAMSNPIYARIAGIKRAISTHPDGPDHVFLEEHGLSVLIQTQ
ncbi:MAG: hypothetical protein HYW63_04160 [Candidatus Levybacteria bacterium]|nr:hypothetical protein [Candidatus Levybacteria bacterium]